MITTEELARTVAELKCALRDAKDRLATRLYEEFPAKIGDIVTCPRTGEHLVERVSPRYDGVVLYLRKKTLRGWDKRESNVPGIETGILNGTVTVKK